MKANNPIAKSVYQCVKQEGLLQAKGSSIKGELITEMFLKTAACLQVLFNIEQTCQENIEKGTQ